jgi:L-malate glycosyltransferase
MKILILTHSYPDSKNKWRGLFIQDQAKALSTKNEITVVYFKVDYSRFRPFSKPSFTKNCNGEIIEYELTICKSFPIINQLKLLFCTYRFIRKEILSEKIIDIIHSHLSYPAGFIGTIIQKASGIPNIITEHSWIRKYFRSLIHKKCVLYALRNSSCFITVSNALKEDINTFYQREIFVIPNVVETDKFFISERKRESILNLGILGGMGNYRKGLDILLKSISLLKTMDLLIHIGGDGILLNKFKEIAAELGVSEKCRFYGEIQPDKINDFYSALDVFVLASRDETFGVVVVEAMSCGLPVIATKCGGPSEIITQGNGVLVEKENPEELAEAIVLISKNLDSYDKEAVRKYAIEKYGPDAFSETMIILYKNILSHKTDSYR